MVDATALSRSACHQIETPISRGRPFTDHMSARRKLTHHIRVIALGLTAIGRTAMTASVTFATGESTVTLMGYAPSATARADAVGALNFDGTSKRFTESVSPRGSSTTLQLHL